MAKRGIVSVAQLFGPNSPVKPHRLTALEAEKQEADARKVSEVRANMVRAFADVGTAATRQYDPEQYRLG